MSLHLVSEIWNAITHSVAMSEERSDLAEQIVNILIDNDYDIHTLRAEFEGDRLIQRAIKNHADFYAEEEVEEYDEEYYDHDDDDDYK